jgi:tRNA threonylcarbamoyladenosine biosynthesis protein TsaE
MSTDTTLAIESTSSDATEKLGQHLGQNLKGGEVIELISDLGGGKTTLVHGIAKGMGSNDKVSSPTFTISKIYKAGTLELCHFDFYRLPEAGLVAHELEDVLNDSGKIIVVEWGGAAAGVLPQKRLKVRIAKNGNESRHFEFHCPKELLYLLKGIGYNFK